MRKLSKNSVIAFNAQNKMLYIIVVFVCGVSIGHCSSNTNVMPFVSQDYTCNKQAIDRLDECVTLAAVLGDSDSKYPTNDQETEAHCK